MTRPREGADPASAGWWTPLVHRGRFPEIADDLARWASLIALLGAELTALTIRFDMPDLDGVEAWWASLLRMSSFLPQVGVCLSVSFLLLGWRDLREDLRRMLEFAGPSRPPLTAIAVHLAASAAFAVVTSWVCTVLLWLVIVARTVLLVLIGPWSATLPDQLAHSHASWFVHFAVLFGLVLAFERAFAHRRDRLAPIEGDAPKPVGRREG